MAELTKEFFEQQIVLLNRRLDNIDRQFNNIDSRFDSNDRKLVNMSDDVFAVKNSLTVLRDEAEEIAKTVSRIDKRDKEDSDAFAKDLVKLQKDLKRLELKHA